MKEYKESIRHSCGHIREVTTLGERLLRRQAKMMRHNPCPRCQLTSIMRVELSKNPDRNPRPLTDEYDEQW